MQLCYIQHFTLVLHRSGGPSSSLMFCTNGVLLRMLTQGDGLQGITHIVVDEVHERDRFADFMLILLRDMLPRHPGLKLVMMSATLHIDLFSAYFGDCPVIKVSAPKKHYPRFPYPFWPISVIS